MGANSLTIYILTEDIYLDTAKDVETKFNTSNYGLERTLCKRKGEKAIGLMKDELSRKLMTEFAALRLKDKDIQQMIVIKTKRCAIKRKFKFEDYKRCLKATQLENNITLPEIIKLMQVVSEKTIKNL